MEFYEESCGIVSVEKMNGFQQILKGLSNKKITFHTTEKGIGNFFPTLKIKTYSY